MTRCFSFPLKSSAHAVTNSRSSLRSLEGTLADNSPGSNAQPSPPANLILEYSLVVQTNSYSEIRSKLHRDGSSNQDINSEQLDIHEEQQLLAQILQPNRECILEALQHARPGTLTHLVSAYFDHSEHTSRLCLLLLRSVHRARSDYTPLRDLLDVLPFDFESLTQPQCDRAFDAFLQFDSLDNPFPCPDSQNFHDMRCCFMELKKQLDCRLSKSHSKVRRIRRTTTSCAICLVGTVVSVVISSIFIATHSIAAFVAVPLIPKLLPSKTIKKELSHLAQLDAAAKGTYVLHNDLDTIDRLIARLHTTFEGDKLLIRLGLERGKEKHPIQEVVKQLHKNHQNLHHQLEDLEEHLYLCFAAINRARSLLLREIHHHQTHCS